jgi:hypothetical protein
MTREKLQETLLFERSDIWDAAIHMLETGARIASDYAIDPSLTPEARHYHAGEAHGFQSALNLLIDTRAEALERANRKVKP